MEMDVQQAADLCRHAVVVILILSLPAMIVGLVVGLVLSFIQSITSLQEQTLTFVPKLILTLVAVVVTLPWTMGYMVEYTQELFRSVAERL